MQFFKSAITLSALVAFVAAVAVDIQVAAPASHLSVITSADAKASTRVPKFSIADGCDAEDEADCKEFCEASKMSPTCSAAGNKVTCYCKGGKAPESKCEERCLFCMPSKSALEEAKLVFKHSGKNVEEL